MPVMGKFVLKDIYPQMHQSRKNKKQRPLQDVKFISVSNNKIEAT